MVTRRKSIPVNVGGVVIGGAAPFAVQTMTKTDTRDVKATLRQIHELKEVGCELARPAASGRGGAEGPEEIVKGSPVAPTPATHREDTTAPAAVASGRGPPPPYP